MTVIFEHVYDQEKTSTEACALCGQQTGRHCVSCKDRPYVCAECRDRHERERMMSLFD